MKGVSKNVVEIIGGREDDFERAILFVKNGQRGVRSFRAQTIAGIRVARAKNVRYWGCFLARYGAAFAAGAVTCCLVMKIV